MTPIEEALNDLNSQEAPNYSQTAKKYGVSRSQLSKRHRGIHGSKADGYENMSLLSKQQQRDLVKYINTLTGKGLPPTSAIVRVFAKDISSKWPGKNWVSRFVNAHSETLESSYLGRLD